MRDLKISKSITNRNEDSLNRYLCEIGQFKLIGTEDEIILARKIREGDRAAINMLVTVNLRFVVSCAKKYQNMGLGLSDLINEGNIGLIRAAQLFDETRGFKFISYAVWWIRQAMTNAIKEHVRVIRVPLNQQLGMTAILKEINKLEQRLERGPTLSEIADALDKSEAQVADFFRANTKTLFLEDQIPGGSSDEATLIDFLTDNEKTIDHWIATEAINIDIARMLRVLKDSEVKVIIMSFGLFGHKELGLQDIADQFRLTKERVRQIRKSALFKLKALPKPGYFNDHVR